MPLLLKPPSFTIAYTRMTFPHKLLNTLARNYHINTVHCLYSCLVPAIQDTPKNVIQRGIVIAPPEQLKVWL